MIRELTANVQSHIDTLGIKDLEGLLFFLTLGRYDPEHRASLKQKARFSDFPRVLRNYYYYSLIIIIVDNIGLFSMSGPIMSHKTRLEFSSVPQTLKQSYQRTE